jgi:predicted nucleic acid-binding Zn finger protein
MRDWYVGQKIVCLNAQPIGGLRNRFVAEYLREGKVYKIRQILVFRFMSCHKFDERLAFRLEGIVPHLIDGVEYAFFHGRFRPLEAGDEEEDISISIFLDDLRKINSGLIQFQDQETPELETIDAGR